MKPTPNQIRRYVEDRFRGQSIGSARKVKLKCPFHDDQKASLAFDLAEGIWFCHAGCGDGGLIDFEVKLNGGSRDEARSRMEEIMHADHLFESRRVKPIAVYPYTDALGRVVFEKLRYEPKRFVQRKPLADGRYQYKLGDVEKPLYRLPEILTANEIVVCEGEKDCDRVLAAFAAEKLPADFRIAATTNFDGAGKWKNEYGIFFAGKRVVILPDNDEPGRVHAETIARNVARYVAGVKIVPLPDLPAKGDVSDYLASHTAADLIAEVKRARAWRPADSGKDGFFVGAQTLASAVPPEIAWTVRDVIPRGWNGFIVADPKSLKSFSLVDLLISLALGKEWLGFGVPRRVRCCLLAREDFWGLTAWRIKSFLQGRGLSFDELDDFDRWLLVNTRAQQATWAIDNDDDLQKLIERLRNVGCEFLAMDVFRRLHFADESDNSEMQKILDRVTKIQSEVGCSIAIVHHTTKDSTSPLFMRTRGASVIHGWMEWGIGLTTVNPDAPPRARLRKMEFLSKAGNEPDPIHVVAESFGDEGAIQLRKASEEEILRLAPPRRKSEVRAGDFLQ